MTEANYGTYNTACIYINQKIHMKYTKNRIQVPI